MRSRMAVRCAVIATFIAPAAAFGQTADLRYQVTQPLQLRYVSVDTATTTMEGPMGEMTTSMNMSATYSMSMSPAGDSIRVGVETDSVAGTMEAMGQTQQIGSEMMAASSEFSIGAGGIDDTVLSIGEIDMETMPTGVGQAAAGALLLLLPARELRAGEMWSDTLTHAGSMSGLELDGTSIVRGTYTGDTAVAGTTYNVLRYVTETNMTASGNMQGMDMDQTTTGERTERVLWDPARRVLVERQHTSSMRMTMRMAAGSVDMSMDGRGSVRLTDGG